MLVLVTYDVSVVTAEGRRRLRRIAKACQDYGMRVQNSVFECEVDPGQFAMLKNELTEIYDPEEDSLRFYFLGKKGRQRVEHHGAKPVVDAVRDPLIL
ncbi:MAG: CRISPR-associated endonuclease Cas2 [Gammaproteobacteria bacterium]